MNDTHVTIVGNVVDDPVLRQTKSGVPVTGFRLASTSRRFDPQTGGWVDNQRLYVSVNVWRGAAENVAESLRRGEPVVVTGRLYCSEYTKDETRRISYELDAVAIGHDLTRGVSQFRKQTRPYAVTSVPVDEAGLPPVVDDDRFADEPDPSEPAGGDPISRAERAAALIGVG